MNGNNLNSYQPNPAAGASGAAGPTPDGMPGMNPTGMPGGAYNPSGAYDQNGMNPYDQPGPAGTYNQADPYNQTGTYNPNNTYMTPAVPAPSPSLPTPPPAIDPDQGKPRKSLLINIACGVIGLLIGGLGIFAIMSAVNAQPNCPECNCPGQSATTGASPLATDFFALEEPSQNIIYSPLSIQYGLSLLDAGAAGSTKDEIESLLGSAKLPTYTNVADTLSLANGIFIRDTFKDSVLSSYTTTVTDDLNAEVIYDNFSSTATMDTWVKDKTFNLIDQLGLELNTDTEMILANALAIQMDWQHKFDTDDTYGATFYQSDDTEIVATTMVQNATAADVSYYTDDNTTLLAMPLQPTDETSLEFVAVMPSGNLESYIESLDLATIKEQLDSATPASTPEAGVQIYIPKFKFDYALDFKSDLENLGLTTAFTDNADFSKMARKPLKVSDAVHKANIDFSEDGIKAAAITAFQMMDITSVDNPDQPKPVVIKINRPFLFLIRDKENGSIWFIGAVYQPNLWENDATEYYNY